MKHPVVVAAALCGLECAVAQDWPMYNHDPAGWRFNAAETVLGPRNVDRLVEEWRFPAAGSDRTIGVVHATPAVVAGEVYFGTATFPTFYKLAPDGTLLWEYRNPDRKAIELPAVGARISAKLRDAASDGGIFSSALVTGGAVYFADTAGWMYCLDSGSGEERWKVNSRARTFPGSHWNNVVMSSPILADDRVVFGGGTLEQLFAGTPAYAGSTGRGFVVALDPDTGKVEWKHDVGPKPQKLDPKVAVSYGWGEHRFTHGPATSSVWSTPSYDAESNTLFFGTDVNTAPRQPTGDDPQLHTEDSCAVRAIDAATGGLKWNTQLNPGDVWTNAMRAYDEKTGLYKDASIGDTPKVVTVDVGGESTKAVGVGCKNGGFYLLRAEDGRVIVHTPLYTGPPTHPPAEHDPRVLALPSPIGGLQSGCATDGETFYTNGIDAVRLGTQRSQLSPVQVPTAGRVVATSIDLTTERWRHERPVIPAMGGTEKLPMYRDVGDIVASGIAVGNGVAYFTAVGSGKLTALDIATGDVLWDHDLGPVFAGPSLSRGHVYVGGGNTLFTPHPFETFFPKQYTGSVRCFGLPDEPRRPPNVVLIMADDMGYTDIGCYGSEIRTPVLDRLAANGLRFTQFYNTSRCCPTRASLLTGLYSHQAGVGLMMSDRGYDAYRGDLDRRCVTIAEALRPAGYRTYMSGKWHVTRHTQPDGRKHNWPLQRGFDRFYGTIIGAGSFYDPATLCRGNTYITPENDPEYRPERFYYTDAISDNAVRYLQEHFESEADRPFFMYVSYTAAHWPMHALGSDMAKYHGVYDEGYEAVREARLRRARELGVIDASWPMSPPARKWKDAKHLEWEICNMEVYAAMVDRMDQGIGRIVDLIEAQGALDDTVIIYLQDNGGCAEGIGRRSNADKIKDVTYEPLRPDERQTQIWPPMQTRDGRPVRTGPETFPGGEDTYTAYGVGWANVSNTPFRGYKHDAYEGGISTPLIVHWPRGIAKERRNAVVDDPSHLIDMMPTLLAVAGAKYPDGVQPMEGISLLPAFAGETLERTAPLCFEHHGNVGLRDGRWKIVSTYRKNEPRRWELYDMVADRTELRDLAAEQPERLRELVDQWEAWAARVGVQPWPIKKKNQRDVKVVPAPKRAELEGEPCRGRVILCADEEFRPTLEALVAALRMRGSTMLALEAEATDPVLRVERGDVGGTEAYRLETKDRTLVMTAQSVPGVARATATLLQLARIVDHGVEWPGMRIEDAPDLPFRCFMVDMGRNPHDPKTLRRVVDAMWYYKANYLHLHLSDDQLFSWPSRAFPKLQSERAGWTWQNFVELERYSQARGVTVIPEIDVPGHSTILRREYPEVFGKDPTELATSPEAQRGLETLIAELLSVFQATPYFHVGGDEAYGVPQEAQRDFINRLNRFVKSQGRRTLVWEGPKLGVGDNKVDTDVIHMNWRTIDFPAQQMLDAGYEVVNAAWDPLYIVDHYPRTMFTAVSVERCYDWDLRRFAHVNHAMPTFAEPHWTATANGILGFCMPWWEGRQQNLLGMCVPRLAAVTAAAWNREGERDFMRFRRHQQALLTRLGRVIGVNPWGMPMGSPAPGNLAYRAGVIVSTGGTQPVFGPRRLTNGITDQFDHFLGYPTRPQRLDIMIAFRSPTKVGRVVVHETAVGESYEVYDLSVSVDGSVFEKVSSAGKGSRGKESFVEHSFPAREIRYIKISTLGCHGLTFPSFSRLTEVMAFEK